MEMCIKYVYVHVHVYKVHRVRTFCYRCWTLDAHYIIDVLTSDNIVHVHILIVAHVGHSEVLRRREVLGRREVLRRGQLHWIRQY